MFENNPRTKKYFNGLLVPVMVIIAKLSPGAKVFSCTVLINITNLVSSV